MNLAYYHSQVEYMARLQDGRIGDILVLGWAQGRYGVLFICIFGILHDRIEYLDCQLRHGLCI